MTRPAGYPTLDARPQLCNRCHRASDVVVEDERGLVVAACVDHLKWAFLTGVDAWTGRWRTGPEGGTSVRTRRIPAVVPVTLRPCSARSA